METMRTFVTIIDKFTHWQGSVVRWLIFPLIFALNYEIVARYFFNAPTVWVYDFTYFFYGGFFMLGGGYTLLKDEHVRIEFLNMKMPPRLRAVIELLGYLILFFPAMGILVYFGTVFAWDSWVMKEHANLSVFAPIIWPFKVILPVGVALTLLQGISKFIQKIMFLYGRKL